MGDEAESVSLVVIGASAGGVDALARLVSTLPGDVAAPIVVAQHADPKGSGRLSEILQRHTQLRVHMLAKDDDDLKAGHLYLAPPGRNLSIKEKRVFSTERQQGHPVPSIDLLFTTAAETYGDRVIAVILTGMGTDGVAGVRAVKERGGTVIVQEIESAAYPALPAAIPTNYVDFTSTIDDLASLLTTLVASGDGVVADGHTLDAFLAQVRGRSGIDFRQYKMPTIRRRLARLMAAVNRNNLADYLRYLNANPDAYQRLISSFLIKVTGFFRDPELFAYLRDTVLPDVIKEARDTLSELRLWSAGCATGEEAYSLAILLTELLGQDVEKLPIRIFATDLDSHAIDFARRAIYPAAAFEDMPADLIAKYFTGVDGAYQVKKQIRNLTVFGEYDLGQRAPFPRIDLVVCRNVLIYFTKELQQHTLQLFAFSLRQGGYLVLGKAETTAPLPQYFLPVAPAVKVFRRQGDRLLIPGPLLAGGLRIPERPSLRRAALRTPLPRRATDELKPRWSLADRLGALLFDSDIGVVLVDRHYDIATINQAARALFGIAGQGIGEDLIHLAQVSPAQLKASLDAAFRGEMPSGGFEAAVRDPGADEERYLTISCYPDKGASRDSRAEGVIVVVTDSTRTGKHLRFLENEFQQSRLAIARLTQHNEELLERQQALVEANGELSTTNDELRNTNEHLMIAAEEAEASAEEVETLNEEMQATSEELETLNEEMHATVEELNTTNEELAARTAELERSAKDQQQQLDSAVGSLDAMRTIVEQLPIVVCVVDQRSTVSLASRQYVQLARVNEGILPNVGEQWSLHSNTIGLRENGATLKYRVTHIRLPEDDALTMLVLTPH